MTNKSNQLSKQAQTLKAAGRLDEAIEVLRRTIDAAPTSGVAEHNLAASLADAGRWREAEIHLRRAFAKGVDAPETWLVLARALLAQSRFGEAERAFLETLHRRSLLYEAQRELAQLRWMMGSDSEAALAEMNRAIRAAPADPSLQLMKAQALGHMNRSADAHDLLMRMCRRWPTDPIVLVTAAQSALYLGDSELALRLATDSLALDPTQMVGIVTHIEACLAIGRPEQALVAIDALRAQAPNNQHALALQALAWRLTGDPRYLELYDYDAMVASFALTAPPGWDDTDAYLADLTEGLTATHTLANHPFNQSIKHGTQAVNLFDNDHPALKALPLALESPIRKYLDHIGVGADPLRARNTGDYAMQGIWSIRMKAGGYHINHVHPLGWISSACHLSVPADMTDKQGWLAFGEPGWRTSPPCAAEHYVEPKRGHIAFFPSYMWHGTIPFAGDGVRLTFALDIVPK